MNRASNFGLARGRETDDSSFFALRDRNKEKEEEKNIVS